MSTFTLQDLTPEQLLTDHLNTPEVPKETKDALTQVLHTRQMGEVLPKPDINTIINTICAQLQLLSTVIKGERAQGATPPEGNQSLQDTVALTLQQADWFKSMVGTYVDEYDFESHVHDAVENVVEQSVEQYFDNHFNPEDHFDFGDAVSDAVDDRLDDIVREKIDECLEEVVAEKLSSASVSISF